MNNQDRAAQEAAEMFPCAACDDPLELRHTHSIWCTKRPAVAAALRAAYEENERLKAAGYWLGIENPCQRCGGIGRRAYGSTATWHGGMGGQMITEAVCDGCWGSGDADKPYRSHRAIDDELAQLRAQVEEARSEAERLYYEGEQKCADLDAKLADAERRGRQWLCDCHTWPDADEAHAYIVALEHREREAVVRGMEKAVNIVDDVNAKWAEELLFKASDAIRAAIEAEKSNAKNSSTP